VSPLWRGFFWWLAPYSLLSFPCATVIGFVLIAAAVVLVVLAVLPLFRAHTAFDARKPTTSIVASGAFRISPNPTYLSLALLQLGVAFSFHSLRVIGTTVPAIAATHWCVIVREERYLGEEVWTVVPRLCGQSPSLAMSPSQGLEAR
jgi:protein-S-isoprenylcysteine O-methyltransferase Ste14